MSSQPVISVSMGDPGGIGPEVLVRALASSERRRNARFQVHGSAMVLHQAAQVCGIDPFWWQVDARSDLASTLGVPRVVLMDTDPQMTDAGIELAMPPKADRMRWPRS